MSLPSSEFMPVEASEGAHSFNLVRVVPILHPFSAKGAFTAASDRWGSLPFSYSPSFLRLWVS